MDDVAIAGAAQLAAAVGVTPRAITQQFVVEAVLLSTLGGTIGLVATLVGSSALPHAIGSALPIPPESFALAFAFSALVGVVLGYLPAHRASRLDPIEALRSE